MTEVRAAVTLSEIQRIVQQIAERFHPRRVILFGSYAGGRPTPDSDVDLLVVMETEEQPLHAAAEIAASIDHLDKARRIQEAKRVKRIDEMMKELPPELQQEVEDFVQFLLEKRTRKPKGEFRFDWEGALQDLRDKYTSVELQHKILAWWGD